MAKQDVGGIEVAEQEEGVKGGGPEDLWHRLPDLVVAILVDSRKHDEAVVIVLVLGPQTAAC
jgi:hypothetical protein